MLALLTKTHAIVLTPALLVALTARNGLWEDSWSGLVLRIRNNWKWPTGVALLPLFVYGFWEFVSQAVGSGGPFTAGYERRAYDVLTAGWYWVSVIDSHKRFTVPFLALAAAGMALSGRKHLPLLLWAVGTLMLNQASGYAGHFITAYLLLPPAAFFVALAGAWGPGRLANAASSIRTIMHTGASRLDLARRAAVILPAIVIEATAVYAVVEMTRGNLDLPSARQIMPIVKQAGDYLAPRVGADERILLGWDYSNEHVIPWYMALANPSHLRPDLIRYWRTTTRHMPERHAYQDMKEAGVRYIVVSFRPGAYFQPNLKPGERAEILETISRPFPLDKQFSDGPWKIAIFDAQAGPTSDAASVLWSSAGDSLDGWEPFGEALLSVRQGGAGHQLASV